MTNDTHHTAPTQFVAAAGIRFAYRPFANRRLGATIDIPLLLFMHFTVNSFILQQNLPNAQLILYPDNNQGAQYQYPELFVEHVTPFLMD
jgi:hypothetical protein